MGFINPLDQRIKLPHHHQYPFSNSSSSNAIQYFTTSSAKSLSTTGLEPFSLDQPNMLLFNNLDNFNPMQLYYPSGKDNMLMFGGTEASCSNSSDGSCSQISYGRDQIKQEPPAINGLQGYNIYDHHHHHHQENQKFVLDYGNDNGGGGTWNKNNNNNHIKGIDDEKLLQNGAGFSSNGTSQLEYELEEVKQLISCSSAGNNGFNSSSSSSSNLLNMMMMRSSITDENKTNERGAGSSMYYYYS